MKEQEDVASERRLFEYFHNIYQEAKQYKWRVAGEFHSEWDRIEAWHDGRASRELTRNKVTPNFIQPIIDLLVSETLGESPMPYFSTDDDAFDLTVDKLNKLTISDWNNQGGECEIYRAVQSGDIPGMGYLWPRYSEAYDAVIDEYLDPRFIFLDPNSDLFLQRCEYSIKATLVPISVLLKRNPELFAWRPGAAIESATNSAMFNADHVYRLGADMPQIKVPNPPGTYASTPNGSDLYSALSDAPRARAVVLTITCSNINQYDWLLSRSARNTAKTWDYPSGEFVLVGNRVAEMRPNSMPEGMMPYTPVGGTMRTNSVYRRGAVEAMITLQRCSDVIHTRVADGVKMAVRAPLAYDTKFGGEPPPYLELEPEMIFPIEGGAGALGKIPMEVPRAAMQFLAHLIGLFYKISGANESASGQKEPGIIAGAAIRQLQQVLTQRNGPKKMLARRGIAIHGRKRGILMLKNYTAEHVAKDLGKQEAVDWDSLRKEANLRYQVLTDAGKTPNHDTESLSKIVIPLIDKGLFDKRKWPDPQSRLEMILPFRDVYPGADRIIMQLNRELKMFKEQAVQQEMTGGQPKPEPAPTALAGAL